MAALEKNWDYHFEHCYCRYDVFYLRYPFWILGLIELSEMAMLGNSLQIANRSLEGRINGK